MTSIIKYSLKELEGMVKDDKTCVSKKTVSQNIAFQPWCLANLKDSLEKIMNNKIGKYDKNLNGIILSYKNVKILDDVYAIRKDNSELFSDVEADFYVFKPHVGATLRGIVSKKSMTHLGVLVHKVFNVVIPTPSNQTSKTWIGSKLNVGQQVEFKIVVLDLFGALPYIRGALDESFLPPLTDEVDSALDVEVEELNSTHVNFDGTKPKFIKKVIKMEESPKKNGDDKKAKRKSKTVEENTPKSKSKHKECVPSDSDFVSDVDDAVLKEQDDLMKKIMLADKKKNKTKNIQTLTASTPGLKKLHDEKIKGIKRNETPTSYKKEVKDTIVIRNRKISLSDSMKNSAENNSVTNVSNLTPIDFNKAEKSSMSPPLSTKKLSKKKSTLEEVNSCSDDVSKKEIKRHSLDSNLSDNGSKTSLVNGQNETDLNNFSDSTSSKMSESLDDERKRHKVEKKRLKQEMKNNVICKVEKSPDSKRKSTDCKIVSPLTDATENVKSSPSSSIVITLSPKKKRSSKHSERFQGKINSPLTNVTSSPSTSVMITLSPKNKRKRKYSESFQSESVKSTEDICFGSDVPAKKKRKKDKSPLDESNQTSNSVDITLTPTSSINSSTKSVKVKKKKKDKEKNKDINNKEESASDRMQSVQALLMELASDPTLLSDIQALIKSRRSK